MEHQAPQDLPHDPRNPHLYVEAADGPAEEAVRARAGGCRHRVPWRDMNPVARWSMVTETLLPALLALVVAALCLLWIVEDVRNAVPGGPIPMQVGVLAAVAALPLAAGAVESLRSMRSLHRPSPAVHRLHGFAFGMLLVGLVLVAPGREWIVLAAVPALGVIADQRQSRALLSDRSTCAAQPDLPEDVAAGMRAWTDDAPPEPPRPPVNDGDEWECPHPVRWQDLRPWAIAETYAIRWLRLAYFFAAPVVLAAVGVNAEAFDVANLGESGVLVLVVVAAVLNLMAYDQWRTGGMHRMPLPKYVWAIIASLATGALGGWAALVLDRPYLWAMAPLALISVYLVIWKYRFDTDPSECRTRPGPHPLMLARLKPRE